MVVYWHGTGPGTQVVNKYDRYAAIIAVLAKKWGPLQELHKLTEFKAENSFQQICIEDPLPKVFSQVLGIKA